MHGVFHKRDVVMLVRVSERRSYNGDEGSKPSFSLPISCSLLSKDTQKSSIFDMQVENPLLCYQTYINF